MYLVSDAFEPYAWIPETYAFGRHDPSAHFAFAANRSPPLRWGDVPAGTRSFALVCFDPDVPSRGDDVNQPDREVPIDLPRVRFWHWTLLDLPPELRAIPEGAHSAGVTQRGKPSTASPIGTTGVNDFTGWFAGDAAMKGRYFGYDGPAPPWNDARVHGYHFRLYALDVATTGMHGSFPGDEALAAIASHVLAEATHVGLYAINPRVRQAHGQPA